VEGASSKESRDRENIGVAETTTTTAGERGWRKCAVELGENESGVDNAVR
jgi:hypothetical protein